MAMMPLGFTNCVQQINLLSSKRSIHQCQYPESQSYNAASTEHLKILAIGKNCRSEPKDVKFSVNNTAKLIKIQEPLFFPSFSFFLKQRVIVLMTQNETLPFSKRSKIYDLQLISQPTNAVKTCSKPSNYFLIII